MKVFLLYVSFLASLLYSHQVLGLEGEPEDDRELALPLLRGYDRTLASCQSGCARDKRDCKKACDKGAAGKSCRRECQNVFQSCSAVCAQEPDYPPPGPGDYPPPGPGDYPPPGPGDCYPPGSGGCPGQCVIDCANDKNACKAACERGRPGRDCRKVCQSTFVTCKAGC